MFEATTSPWYSPTWVSSRTPVTSPSAHSPSARRSRASTGRPAGPAVTPTVSRPIPAQSPAVSEGQHEIPPVPPRPDRAHAEEQFDAFAAQHLAKGLAKRRG